MANSNEPQTTTTAPDVRVDAIAPEGQAHGAGTVGPTAHTGGGATQPVEPAALHIRLDRQDIEISADLLHDGTLTGRQIRELVEPPFGADRDLFEIVPGGSDRKIEDGDTVVILDHIRFFSAPRNINPGAAEGQSAHRRSVRHAAQ